MVSLILLHNLLHLRELRMKIIAGFQTPGSEILVYSLTMLHTQGFFYKMPELHNFVILGVADTFHERTKVNT